MLGLALGVRVVGRLRLNGLIGDVVWLVTVFSRLIFSGREVGQF